MSKNFLDNLKAQTKQPNSTYIQFLQKYKKSDNALHLFFEGQDDPSFYLNFISQMIDENIKIHIYNSGNKDSVYKNHSRINWTEYQKNRVLFFVDKDHSDFLGISYSTDDNIFVTKYYSIENYLVNEQVLERILIDLFHFTDHHLIEEISKNFAIQHQKFCELMLVVTSWIIYWRKRKRPINLNNLKVGDFFSIGSEMEVVRKRLPKNTKLLEYLNKQCGVEGNSIMWKEMTRIVRELNKVRDHKKHLRGKFELWFIVFYSNTLVKRLNEKRQAGENKIKCHTSLGINNAVEVLGTRCKIPEDLKKFLQSNLREAS